MALTDAPTGVTTTRHELLEEARHVARLLLKQGVVAEQRILICSLDTRAFLAWFWGAMWVGAIPVPVSTMLTAKDYRFLLEDSRAVALIYSHAFEQVMETAAAGQPYLKWSRIDDDVPDLVAEIDLGNPFLAVDDDIAFWLYTSGTTGFPKGAMHRHVDLGFCTDVYAKAVLGMDSDDVIYSVAKLFFAYGLGNAGYFPAGTGAQSVLNPGRPIPEEISEHV